MKNCEDIFTLHAPLIHPAVDIQFQLKYKNGLLDAEIKLLDPAANSNVQRVLEDYFSKVGIPIKGEYPTGAKNSVNLTFTTVNEFIPATLEVYLSGMKLNGNQSDPDRDYDIITTGPNTNKGFTLVLDTNKYYRLNSPPFQHEPLTVNYAKRITFNTIGGT